MKTYLIMAGIILLLLTSSVVLVNLLRKEKAENTRLTENIKETHSKWEDEKGRRISETSMLRTHIREVKNIFKRDSSSIVNNYEKRIYSLKGELKTLGIEIERLKGYTGGTVIIRDTVYIPIYSETEEEVTGKYNGVYLKADITLKKKEGFILDYSYQDTVNVVNIVSVKRRSNGKKYPIFPNWRWLWGQDEKNLLYMNNPKADVDSHFSIKIEK